jgi:hypothetical protein
MTKDKRPVQNTCKYAEKCNPCVFIKAMVSYYAKMTRLEYFVLQVVARLKDDEKNVSEIFKHYFYYENVDDVLNVVLNKLKRDKVVAFYGDKPCGLKLSDITVYSKYKETDIYINESTVEFYEYIGTDFVGCRCGFPGNESLCRFDECPRVASMIFYENKFSKWIEQKYSDYKNFLTYEIVEVRLHKRLD